MRFYLIIFILFFSFSIEKVISNENRKNTTAKHNTILLLKDSLLDNNFNELNSLKDSFSLLNKKDFLDSVLQDGNEQNKKTIIQENSIKPKEDSVTIKKDGVKLEVKAQYHIVQKNENVFRISLKYPVHYKKIQELNRLSDNPKLVVGQKLYLGEFKDTIYKNRDKLIERKYYLEGRKKQIPKKKIINEPNKEEKVIAIEKEILVKTPDSFIHKKNPLKITKPIINENDQTRFFTRPPLIKSETKNLKSSIKRNLKTIEDDPKKGIKILSHYYYSLELRFRILWIIIFVFFLTNLYLILRISFRRYHTNQEANYRKRLIPLLQKNLVYLILTKKFNDKNEKEWYDSAKNTLKKSIISRENRALILDLLIQSRRILKGTPVKNIVTLYKEFGYEKLSFKKISTPYWQIKIKGVRELSLMHIDNSKDKIISLFNHENVIVRMEAKMAILRLLEYDGLKYLFDTQKNISKWVQTEMLDSIKHFRTDTIPDCSYCLDSPNNSVVILTIHILNYLNQISAKEKLIEILKLKNQPLGIEADIRIEIIKTLWRWRVLDVKEYLKELYIREENMYVKEEIIFYFVKLGTKDDLDFITNSILEKNYLSNVYSLRAIYEIIGNDKLIANKILSNAPEEKREMVAHFLKLDYKIPA